MSNSFSKSTNQVTPTNCSNNSYFCYDVAGNVLSDGSGASYAYDAEGRITSFTSSSATANYAYDAVGQRVHRVVNSNTYDYVFDNAGNENSMTTNGLGNRTWSNYYFGGQAVTTVSGSSPSDSWNHIDYLGTPRLQTSSNGTPVNPFTSFTWGESSYNPTLSLAGMLMDGPDAEDTYHTPARQFNEWNGRWMTPDPAGLSAARIGDPQTWNRYAYAGNNPVSMTDPSGLEPDGENGAVGPAGTLDIIASSSACPDSAPSGSSCTSWVIPNGDGGLLLPDEPLSSDATAILGMAGSNGNLETGISAINGAFDDLDVAEAPVASDSDVKALLTVAVTGGITGMASEIGEGGAPGGTPAFDNIIGAKGFGYREGEVGFRPLPTTQEEVGRTLESPWWGPEGTLRANGAPNISLKIESADGLGQWRFANHYGVLGTSTQGLYDYSGGVHLGNGFYYFEQPVWAWFPFSEMHF
jgi:RHS repeat-associated protein